MFCHLSGYRLGIPSKLTLHLFFNTRTVGETPVLSRRQKSIRRTKPARVVVTANERTDVWRTNVCWRVQRTEKNKNVDRHEKKGSSFIHLYVIVTTFILVRWVGSLGCVISSSTSPGSVLPSIVSPSIVRGTRPFRPVTVPSDWIRPGRHGPHSDDCGPEWESDWTRTLTTCWSPHYRS